jgi:uncharacterized delta-60 repeat protein
MEQSVTGTLNIRALLRALFLAACPAVAPAVAHAQVFRPDPSFGSGGVAEFNVASLDPANWGALQVQADGKLLLMGSVESIKFLPGSNTTLRGKAFAFVRLNATGTLDRTFNPGGPTPGTLAQSVDVLPWEAGTYIQFARALHVHADGSFLAAGSTGAESVFVKIRADGSRDTALNSRGALPGTLVRDLGTGREAVYTMAGDAQGRYILGGVIEEPDGFKAFVARMLPTGRLDDTFHPGGAIPGLKTFSIAVPIPGVSAGVSTTAEVSAIAVTADGRIVIGGHAAAEDPRFGIQEVYSNVYPFCCSTPFVARLNSDGAFDNSFAGDSTIPGVRLLPNPDVQAHRGAGDRLVLGADGTIVFATSAGSGSGRTAPSGIIAFRLGAAGAVDTTFGTQTATHPGVLVVPPTGSKARGDLHGIGILGDGGLLVAATTYFPDERGSGYPDISRVFLARLTSAGVMDETYGNIGPGGAPGYVVLDSIGRSTGTNPQWPGFAAISAERAHILVPKPKSLAGRHRVYAVDTATGIPAPAFGAGQGWVHVTGIDNGRDQGAALVRRADGSFYVAADAIELPGTAVITRLTSGGAVDTSVFAGGDRPGSVAWVPQEDTPRGLGSIKAAFELADGSVLIAADSLDLQGRAGATVLRLGPDGAAQPDFGNGAGLNGTFFQRVGSFTSAEHAALDASGRVLLANLGNLGGAYAYRAVLSRVRTNGMLDTSFSDGTNDYVVENFGRPSDSLGRTVDSQARRVLVQADGRILLVGASGNSLAIARYLSSGERDPTFNAAGAVPGTVVFSTVYFPQDAKLDAEGYLVIVDQYCQVARISPTGVLDTRFGGGDGIANINGCNASAVQPAPDGSIYVASGPIYGQSSRSDLFRLTPNGTLDTAFGTSVGSLGSRYPLSENGEDWVFIETMDVDERGRILLVGHIEQQLSVRVGERVDIPSNTYIARFLPANLVDGTCGSASGTSLAQAPTANLCATGQASAVSGTATGWSWSCTGSSGIVAACEATASGGGGGVGSVRRPLRLDGGGAWGQARECDALQLDGASLFWRGYTFAGFAPLQVENTFCEHAPSLSAGALGGDEFTAIRGLLRTGETISGSRWTFLNVPEDTCCANPGDSAFQWFFFQFNDAIIAGLFGPEEAAPGGGNVALPVNDGSTFVRAANGSTLWSGSKGVGQWLCFRTDGTFLGAYDEPDLGQCRGGPETRPALPDLVAVPDVDSDGIEDLALVAGRDPVTVRIRNGRTGATLASANVAMKGYRVLAVTPVDDSDGDGVGEVALLAERDTDTLSAVFLVELDARGNRLVPLPPGHAVRDITSAGDANGDGITDVGVLARRLDTGRSVVITRNLKRDTACGTSTCPFATSITRQAAGAESLALVTIPPSPAFPEPRYAVLSRRAVDGRGIVQVTEPSASLGRLPIVLNADRTPLDIDVLRDTDGAGGHGFAVLLHSNIQPRNLIQWRNVDSASGGLLKFPAGLTSIAVRGVPDANDNGIPELASLGIRDRSGSSWVQSRDAVRVKTDVGSLRISPPLRALRLGILNDVDLDGIPEFGLLTQQGNGGALLIRRRDAAGTDSVFAYPP